MEPLQSRLQDDVWLFVDLGLRTSQSHRAGDIEAALGAVLVDLYRGAFHCIIVCVCAHVLSDS